MKCIKTAILAVCILLMLSSVCFAEVEVHINGREISFEEQAPVIVDGTTLVPLRKIFEELGAHVDWIKDSKTVYATRRFSYVMMTIGSDRYTVDGEEKTLSVAPCIYNERTMVPVRAVSESLGADIEWDKENRRVLITSYDGEITVKDRYINYSDTAQDGTVLFTGRVAYPELLDDNDIVTSFNEYIRGDVEEVILRGRSDCYYPALDAYENSITDGYEFLPYMAEHSFDITYNKDKLISIVCADSNFAGWTHPNYFMYAMTYNLTTGKAVSLPDLFDMSEDALFEMVYDNFSDMIEEKPESFYHDAPECLKDALSQLKWYLAEDGVHFFINPYEIAPYAAGVIETVLPINKN